MLFRMCLRQGKSRTHSGRKPVGTQFFGQAKKELSKAGEGTAKAPLSKAPSKKAPQKPQEPKKKGKGGKAAAKH